MSYNTPPPKIRTRSRTQSIDSVPSDTEPEEEIYDPVHINDPVHGYIEIPDG
eukprot:CAMPEP_0197057818 /NCGR_PEP_ID=MMETSP1384-20130603/101160_1 /TAXON_ID=29189 /ORGANISM="Ammonia sp." /LENGTH=51 /DNA_ID=CAMNT_0042492363 /DNA_START=27 /DNA_END=179 /DNA_ORIENTATION=+